MVTISRLVSRSRAEATDPPVKVRCTPSCRNDATKVLRASLIGDAAMVEVEQVDRTVSGQEELTRLAVAVHDGRRVTGNAEGLEETFGQAQQAISRSESTVDSHLGREAVQASFSTERMRVLTIGPRWSWASAAAASPIASVKAAPFLAGRQEEGVERLAGDRLLHDHRDVGQVTEGGRQPQAAAPRRRDRRQGFGSPATAAALAASW